MGSIVTIYAGPSHTRTLEGKAELVEVRYKGNGKYIVKCIFVNDPKKRVHWRELDIEESIQGKGELS